MQTAGYNGIPESVRDCVTHLYGLFFYEHNLVVIPTKQQVRYFNFFFIQSVVSFTSTDRISFFPALKE
jgi:hypothetical protein